MSATADYYKVLHLDRSADPEDVRKSYRHLALKYHPDRSSDPDARQIYLSLAESFHVLSDLKKRAIYDQYGQEGLKKGVPARADFEGFEGGYQFHGNADEVFNQFFGGNNPYADFFGAHGAKTPFGKKFGGLQGMNTPNAINLGPVKNTSQDQVLSTTLEELYNGSLRKIKVSRKILNQNTSTTSEVDKILTIEIHKGWKDGTRLIFPAEGDQGPNKLAGDIVFTVKQQKHDRFERSGDDLVFTGRIPLVAALTGTVVDIKTLDGRLLKVPINETIGPNYVKRVPGEGMPLSKTPNQRGDLLIKFETAYPAYLTDEQKALLKKAFL